jgi:hypothetical protein
VRLALRLFVRMQGATSAYLTSVTTAFVTLSWMERFYTFATKLRQSLEVVDDKHLLLTACRLEFSPFSGPIGR